MPHVKFAYNRSVHLATKHSQFEVVYGFNPLNLLDLMPLPIEDRASLDGKKKSESIEALHKNVQLQIEKRIEHYVPQHNKGWKKVVFDPAQLSTLLSVFVVLGLWPVCYVLGLCVLYSTTLNVVVCLRSPRIVAHPLCARTLV